MFVLWSFLKLTFKLTTWLVMISTSLILCLPYIITPLELSFVLLQSHTYTYTLNPTKGCSMVCYVVLDTTFLGKIATIPILLFSGFFITIGYIQLLSERLQLCSHVEQLCALWINPPWRLYTRSNRLLAFFRHLRRSHHFEHMKCIFMNLHTITKPYRLSCSTCTPNTEIGRWHHTRTLWTSIPLTQPWPATAALQRATRCV